MPTIIADRVRSRDTAFRYTSALRLLGEAEQTQKLAGIYALEGLAREPIEAQLKGAIIEVLAAFVRRYAHREALTPATRTSIEVQAALTALGRAPQAVETLDRPLDLHGIALREAYLPLCYFERAFLYDCDFEGALLVGAHLRGAWLARANLTRANLDGADLRGTDFTGARGLNPATLSDVLWDADTRWP